MVPIAFECDREDDAPYVTLLGTPLVFWKNKGEYSGVADMCPHRLARYPKDASTIKVKSNVATTGGRSKGRAGNAPIPTRAKVKRWKPLNSPRACATPHKSGKVFYGATRRKWTEQKRGWFTTATDSELDDPQRYQDMFRDLPMDYSTLLKTWWTFRTFRLRTITPWVSVKTPSGLRTHHEG